ncbi:MAG TPA: CBS domain-containing protein [Gemmatimonadales bacterium]|nr:CBS domain-containing protein [Gemmatimonadales bacterium]
MNVKDIMTTNPAVCTPGDTIRDAANAMRENDCGLIPVVEDQQSKRLTAVITDRDIAIRAVAQGKGPDTLVRDVMSDGPDAVHPTDDVNRVEQVMRTRQVRRVPVIDDNGSIVGIVSQADLATQTRAASDSEVGRVVSAVSEPRGREEGTR